VNTLYYGDNLPILRDYIDEESIDLVYLDPPFKSNQDSASNQNAKRKAATVKDNEHEEKPEHGTESRTTTNRLAQIEVVQCGRRMVEIGRCLSNESSWGLACHDNQQRQRPDFLPGP
jgi:16S rRNA G966 N2-methylase RsmD